MKIILIICVAVLMLQFSCSNKNNTNTIDSESEKQLLKEELDDEALEKEVYDTRTNMRGLLDLTRINKLGMTEEYIPEEPNALFFFEDSNMVLYEFVNMEGKVISDMLKKSNDVSAESGKVIKITIDGLLIDYSCYSNDNNTSINAVIKLGDNSNAVLLNIISDKNSDCEKILKRYVLLKK